MDIQYFGNKELLKLDNTAFLASSTIPPEMVLKCYDWAAGEHNGCVISGFSSKLEKDVLHFLLKTTCPVIVVLARKMYKVMPDVFQELLKDNRLLIISISNSPRQSKATAYARNRYVCEIADKIIFVVATEKSTLFELKEEFHLKEISFT